jgi:hypothetical protein
MEMSDTTTLLLVAGGVILLALLLGLAFYRWSRSRALRRRLGPEYDHLVAEAGDSRAARKELAERRHRVEKYPLRELAANERRDFGARWRGVQVEFVDDPQQAVEAADRLIVEVMAARGYPATDFRQRLADTSVSYPEMAADYRDARQVAERSRRGAATTEELRRAMVCYRNLFSALLGAAEVPVAGISATAPRQPRHH